jgi:hypothetical protein
LRACQSSVRICHNKMTQWHSKSAVAREERISRRTVQRRCREWETLPGNKKKDPVTDQQGRVNLEAYRRWDEFVKSTERRGFPLRGQRRGTIRWQRLMRALRDRKAFGRTLADRIKIIRSEIDEMSDREQTAVMLGFGGFFRAAAVLEAQRILQSVRR